MPKDLGTWGFILSLAALLLMYPVGLLINLTSPKIQNWWAARSQQSVVKRLNKLESELGELEEFRPLEEVENEILWGQEMLMTLVGGCTHLLLAAALVVCHYVIPSNESHKMQMARIFLFVIMLVNLGTLRAYRHKKSEYRYTRSPARRARLKASILKLRTDLSKHGTGA
jgi:hypothetical protein